MKPRVEVSVQFNGNTVSEFVSIVPTNGKRRVAEAVAGHYFHATKEQIAALKSHGFGVAVKNESN